jgi:predicted amidohydrolase
MGSFQLPVHEVVAVSAPILRVAAIPLVSPGGGVSSNVTNVSRVTERLALAAREGIGLAVFPEACLAECANFAKLSRRELDALAERIDGPSVSAVADAVDATGVTAGVGLIERAPDGRLFNSYVICLPGGMRYCHRKLYAFEHRRIECGNRFTVFDTVWGVRIAVLIGGDNYLIENVRMTALMGATLLVAPHRRYRMNRNTACELQPMSVRHASRVDAARDVACSNAGEGEGNDHSATGGLRHWLPARAADNGMFVAFSDSAEADADAQASDERGRERHTAMIVDPCGRILADKADRASAFVSAELDSALIGASAGRQWLESRRAELYGPLAQTENQAPAIARTSAAVRGGAVPLSFAVVGRDRLTRGGNLC